MSTSQEIFSVEDTLRQQIHISESQLMQLRAVAKAGSFNSVALGLLTLHLLLALIYFLVVVFSPTGDSLIRPELYPFSGPILIFVIFGLAQTARALFSTRLRYEETEMMVERQQDVLGSAREILDHSRDDQ